MIIAFIFQHLCPLPLSLWLKSQLAVHPGDAVEQPLLEESDFIIKVFGDVIVWPHIFPPMLPSLAVTLNGTM